MDVDGPRYVYSNAVEGDLTLVDAYNGDRRDIHPVAGAGQPPLRWEWMTPAKASRTAPIMVSSRRSRSMFKPMSFSFVDPMIATKFSLQAVMIACASKCNAPARREKCRDRIHFCLPGKG